jgi:two-component system sensor kinase FixL
MEDRFFSEFSSTKKNGMGIGFSISKNIIEEHGGTIHYANNRPTGSVFYFMLPFVEHGLPHKGNKPHATNATVSTK